MNLEKGKFTPFFFKRTLSKFVVSDFVNETAEVK